MKELFERYVNQYIKYSTIRLSILLILFFSFSNAIKKYADAPFQDRIGVIKKISEQAGSYATLAIEQQRITDSITSASSVGLNGASTDRQINLTPEAGTDSMGVKRLKIDWLIDAMYFSEYSLKDYSEFIRNQSTGNENEQGQTLIRQLDSLNQKLQSEVKSLVSEVTTVAVVEMPFMKDLKFDLRLWLLYLPIFLFLSELMPLAITRNIRLIVEFPASSENKNLIEELRCSPFYYPAFKKTALFLKFLEILISLAFIDIVAPYFLKLDFPYLMQMTAVYSMSFYYVWAIYHRQRVHDMVNAYPNEETVIKLIGRRLYRFYCRALELINKSGNAKLTRAAGFLLILTLLLNMSQCRGTLIKGYQLFGGLSQWNIDGKVYHDCCYFLYANSLMKWMYVLVILCSLILIVYSFFKTKRQLLELFYCFFGGVFASFMAYFFWKTLPLITFTDLPLLGIAVSFILAVRYIRRPVNTIGFSRISNIHIVSLFILPLYLITTFYVVKYAKPLYGLPVYWLGLHIMILGLIALKNKSALFSAADPPIDRITR